jgi:hypothetical protein
MDLNMVLIPFLPVSTAGNELGSPAGNRIAASAAIPNA